MYRILLFDLDDTILDFKAAEEAAISTLLARHGQAAARGLLERYSLINKGLWEKLERREILLDEVLTSRFERFFASLDILVDGREEDVLFRQSLNGHAKLMPGAAQLLEKWREYYFIYAVSNGVFETQVLRLKKAGIFDLFHGLFISGEVGFNKPDPRFFTHVRKAIPSFSADEALIIGDSLTSDIGGGNAAGIPTCWFNRFQMPFPEAEAFKPTYEIHALSELDAILGSVAD